MSFHRTLLAAVAAAAFLAAPAFADDHAMQMSNNNQQTTTTTSPTGTTTTTTTTTTTQTTKVNLNTATAKQLLKIKGVNGPRARAIIAYRKKHGNFKSTDDLENIDGFKKLPNDKLKSIENQVTVD